MRSRFWHSTPMIGRTGPANARVDGSGFTRLHRWASAAFAVLLLASWWDPPKPATQALHHSLTAVALVALAWAQRRRAVPGSSFVLVLCFLSLHTVAARWLYSYVPYDDWSQAVAGLRLSDVFGWQRNHFDRLVHLTYGLCAAPVLHRYLTERRSWRNWPAAAASVEIVVSTSALYELFEWGVAVVLAPEAAEAYNGQQGDAWDAHRDMALATLGALLAAATAGLLRRRLPRNGSPPRPARVAGTTTTPGSGA